MMMMGAQQYKVRSGSGMMAIFEVNIRVGGDIADDAPRWQARTFFERLERSVKM